MKAAHVWAIVILLLLVAPLALAQNSKQSEPKYDPASEVKIKGTVSDIKQIPEGKITETHLILTTDKGPVEVCLCPAKFLSALDLNFQKGDQLEVTGAKAKEGAEGGEVILAREIVRGENTLVLRDKKGGPVWTWLVKE